MSSIWLNSVSFASSKALSEDIQTDIAVIGGGLSGILIAYYLKQENFQVVVLEANTIGSGQTQNTTAKITSQHGLIYHKLIDSMGLKYAKQYAESNRLAIEEYRKLIEDKKIDCNFESCSSFLYTKTENRKLINEAKASQKAGIDCELTTDTELPFLVQSALKFPNQAKFHPLKFLKALADGLTIFENTPVIKIEGCKIYTADGHNVTAKQIVIACHYPFINVPGYYFMRMHQERSYVLALKNTVHMQNCYLGIDKENSFSFRTYKDMLLFGGKGHRTGENRLGGAYETLRHKAKEFWPNSIECAHWSAQDCMTLDGVAYIGRFSASTPNLYVATGFNKWGMTSSMVSAMLIKKLICEKGSKYAPLFSPQRFFPSASAASFLKEGVHAVKYLAMEKFALPRDKLEALKIGHGGVVDYNGMKVGAYKDENGNVFLVSIRCPHLGCQLEWNPDEKSWDCPCHGSRFDYHGNLIDNPAQRGVSHA